MKKLIIVLLVICIVFVFFSTKRKTIEPFTSLEDKIQARTNPLAIQTSPIKNPAAEVGISEKDASALQKMMITALNPNEQIPTGDGNVREVVNYDPLSPRLDTENDLLGHVKFCEEQGKKENPFEDPKFSQLCGMCMTSGSLITGETFSGPTGVVVWPADKERAYKRQKENNTPFPIITPTLKAATCTGSSGPSLAINQKDFQTFKQRHTCQQNSTLTSECAVCQSNNTFSYIPASGGRQMISLILYGKGSSSVQVNTKLIKTVELNESMPSQIELGVVNEADLIQINTTDSIGVFIYGALVSKVPNGTPFTMDISKFIRKDSETGSTPKTGGTNSFSEVRLFLTKLIPSRDQKKLLLEGTLPLTFVEADQLASIDCPNAPYLRTEEAVDLFTTDPCLKRGQKPGSYSEECVKSKVLEGGCSASGDLYKSPMNLIGSKSITDFLSYVRGLVSKQDVKSVKFCTGKDVSTPCDTFLENKSTPDKTCLSYLYSNVGAKGRLGNSYQEAAANESSKYQSLTPNSNPQFCQKEGGLNPETSDGYSRLSSIAQKGYGGTVGIDAVRKYLSDVYKKATGDLDINKEDAKGGKKTSWELCFGPTIALAPTGQVRLNSQGIVQENRACTSLLTSFTPQQNKLIGTIPVKEDWSLSFIINPRDTFGDWTSIIHFTITGKDCCSVGDRTPAIFFIPNTTRLHIRIGDTKEANWGVDMNAIPLNQDSSIYIECKGKNVLVNINNTITTYLQPNQRASGTAKVYGGSPWRTPANCEIKNLCYRTL